MGGSIVRILTDGTPLNIKATKLKQLFLKDTTFFRRKLRHKQLVGIAGIPRIAATVFHIAHYFEKLCTAIYPFWNWVAKYLGWIPIFAGPAANPSRTVATVSVVLAVMILPIITSMSRDIFLQPPRLQEEAALALGATKWEMVKLAVLPCGNSGVVSASMLGLGRALGETMAVLMILSPGLNYSVKLLQASQNQTIAANIAAQYPEANDLGVSVLIGTGLVLFLITFVVNFIARKLTEKASV